MTSRPAIRRRAALRDLHRCAIDREKRKSGVVYHITGAANAKRSHLGRRTAWGIGSRGRWDRDDECEYVCACALAYFAACEGCSIDMGIEPDGVAILAVKSSLPGGVGGDADDAGEVDAECDASGVGGMLLDGEVGGER